MWFYAINNEQFGPIDEAAMRRLVQLGVVTANTLVWKAGMLNWAPAGTVGLVAAAAQRSPPSPSPPPAPRIPPPPPAALTSAASSETRTLALWAHVLGLLTSFL